jgi:hypothetical protein
MKKLLIGLLGFVLVFQAAAQQKPFIGYDKVAWGVSVANVRKAYDISEDIAVTVDEGDTNISRLTQENISASISERQFMFNGDKLYRVWVYYKDASDSAANTLKGLIESRYGRATNFTTGTSKGGGWPAAEFTRYETYTYYSTYAPDIEVFIVQIRALYDKDLSSAGTALDVCYTWKKFRDEYQASKLGL